APPPPTPPPPTTRGKTPGGPPKPAGPVDCFPSQGPAARVSQRSRHPHVGRTGAPDPSHGRHHAGVQLLTGPSAIPMDNGREIVDPSSHPDILCDALRARAHAGAATLVGMAAGLAQGAAGGAAPVLAYLRRAAGRARAAARSTRGVLTNPASVSVAAAIAARGWVANAHAHCVAALAGPALHSLASGPIRPAAIEPVKIVEAPGAHEKQRYDEQARERRKVHGQNRTCHAAPASPGPSIGATWARSPLPAA